jgi:NTP pyrophosphatase (non-canonical NTP hydrolase)
MEEAGEVAEDLRKEDFRALSRDLPDIFAWLCAFTSKYGAELEEIVWHKFPAMCPYCEREQRCICIAESYPKYEPGRLNDYRNRAERKPRTLEEWQRMFQAIYGNVNKVVPRSAIGFHLMEEISEVAKEIRYGNRENCKAELADVFAWIMAMVMKIQLDFREFSFSDALWEAYPGICKICKKERCTCEVRPTLRSPRE